MSVVVKSRIKAPLDDEYTPEQRKIIDGHLAEGLADIEAGRLSGPYSTAEEFSESLKQEARKLTGEKLRRSS